MGAFNNMPNNRKLHCVCQNTKKYNPFDHTNIQLRCPIDLTHLPLVPYIYASVNWISIVWGNGLSPIRRQVIAWKPKDSSRMLTIPISPPDFVGGDKNGMCILEFRSIYEYTILFLFPEKNGCISLLGLLTTRLTIVNCIVSAKIPKNTIPLTTLIFNWDARST